MSCSFTSFTKSNIFHATRTYLQLRCLIAGENHADRFHKLAGHALESEDRCPAHPRHSRRPEMTTTPVTCSTRDGTGFFNTLESIARIAHQTAKPQSSRECTRCGEKAEFYLQVRAPTAIVHADHSDGRSHRYATTSSLRQTNQLSCSMPRKDGVHRSSSRLLDLPYAPRPPTSPFDHKASESP